MALPLTIRAKLLIAIAGCVAAYVVFAPDDTQTVEPAHEEGAQGLRHSAEKPVRPITHVSYGATRRVVTGATASALFTSMSWYVPPPAPAPAAVVAVPPPAPTAPPLPFAYMGSYRPEGTSPTFFLTAGDRVYDVQVGDTLDNTYSVDGVRAGQLLLTYKPLKIQQTLAVGEEP